VARRIDGEARTRWLGVARERVEQGQTLDSSSTSAMRNAVSECSAGKTSSTSPRTRNAPRLNLELVSLVLHRHQARNDVALRHLLFLAHVKDHAVIVDRIADTVDARDSRDDHGVPIDGIRAHQRLWLADRRLLDVPMRSLDRSVATVSCIYGIGDPVDYHGMILHVREKRRCRSATSCAPGGDETRETSIEFKRGAFRVRGTCSTSSPRSLPRRIAHRARRRRGRESGPCSTLSRATPASGPALHRLSFEPTIDGRARRRCGRSKRIKSSSPSESTTSESGESSSRPSGSEQRHALRPRMLNELGFCKGIENYSRTCPEKRSEPPPTLIDYLPPNASCSSRVARHHRPSSAECIVVTARARRTSSPTVPPPSATRQPPAQVRGIQNVLRQTVFVSATPGNTSASARGRSWRGGAADRVGGPGARGTSASTQVDDLLGGDRPEGRPDERVLVTTLTKRMARAHDYLAEHGVKVRYLHSEVETVERVGNHPRPAHTRTRIRRARRDQPPARGLDCPRCQLVGSSTRTGGFPGARAVAHSDHRPRGAPSRRMAILYADRVTDSMKRADRETTGAAPSRSVQRESGHHPIGISKQVRDMIEGRGNRGRGSAAEGRAEQARLRVDCRETTRPGDQRLENRCSTTRAILEFEKGRRGRDRLASSAEISSARLPQTRSRRALRARSAAG